MYLSEEELKRLKEIGIEEANREELLDLREISMDTNKPVQERIKDYMEQAGNPYLVKVGEYIVKIEYADCEETLNDRMKEYISRLAASDGLEGGF